MKKIINALICLLVIISVLAVGYISPMAVNYAFNDEIPLFLVNSSTVYFSHLGINFANNQNDTCGYVALAMLLSYYDSYWADLFIAEDYDVNGIYSYDEHDDTIIMVSSPGIEKEPNYSSLADSYEELVALYNDEYFQLMLIELQTTMYPGSDPNDTTYNYSLNPWLTYALMLCYFDNRGLLDSSHFTVRQMETVAGYSQEDIRSKMIENITSGVPMIYHGLPSSNSTVGHVMIAYDYDGDNDEIYFHTGWLSNRVISESINPYPHAVSITWIEMNPDYVHTCSTNYIESNSGQAVCMCKFAFHPDHTHTLDGNYLSYTSSSHIQECTYCDGSAAEAHSLVYRKISGTLHSITCECGYDSAGVHIVKSGGNTCVLCKTIVEHGNVTITSLKAPVIFENNSELTDTTYLMDNGIIVLSDRDYALFMEGNLTLIEIYEKVGLTYE